MYFPILVCAWALIFGVTGTDDLDSLSLQNQINDEIESGKRDMKDLLAVPEYVLQLANLTFFFENNDLSAEDVGVRIPEEGWISLQNPASLRVAVHQIVRKSSDFFHNGAKNMSTMTRIVIQKRELLKEEIRVIMNTTNEEEKKNLTWIYRDIDENNQRLIEYAKNLDNEHNNVGGLIRETSSSCFDIAKGEKFREKRRKICILVSYLSLAWYNFSTLIRKTSFYAQEFNKDHHYKQELIGEGVDVPMDEWLDLFDDEQVYLFGLEQFASLYVDVFTFLKKPLDLLEDRLESLDANIIKEIMVMLHESTRSIHEIVHYKRKTYSEKYNAEMKTMTAKKFG